MATRKIRRSHEQTSMETLYIIILCILGGALNLLFTSACDADDDCPYTEQQCCVRGRYTPSGNVLDEGICIVRYYPGRCHEICRRQDDCVLPQRCDTSEFLCTTECFSDEHCHHINREYVCYNEVMEQNACKMPADQEDSSMESTYLYYILIGSVVIFFCICCTCLKFRQGRNRGAARRMVTSNARPTGTNVQPNENAERPETNLQMNSTQTPPEVSSPNIDAIALSGPPSYIEVGNVPESPPPTYEEATKT